MNNVPWTPDEEAFLIEHAELTHQQLSTALARRSASACRQRRDELRRAGRITLPAIYSHAPSTEIVPTSKMPMQRNSIELRNVDSFVVFGDPHFPFQHGPFMTAVSHLAKAWGIKTAIINGDVFDFSHFKQYAGLEDDPSLEAELFAGETTLKALLSIFDDIYIDTGNHDARLLQRLLNSALSLRRFLHLFTDSPNVHMTKCAWIKVLNADAKWIAGHPDRYSKIPGKKALDIAKEKYPDFHVISAHDHNVGMMLRRNSCGTFWSIGPGACMEPSRIEYSEGSFNDLPNMNVGAVLVKDNRPFLVTLQSDFEALAKMYGRSEEVA